MNNQIVVLWVSVSEDVDSVVYWTTPGDSDG